ncbi:unnamed protein product [Arabidopsis lyrata]|nr:unnamed protein product [Arabidopsis lyrata]
MANRHGDVIAHVKRNNVLVDVHHGSNGYFLMMKNGRVLTRARWPKNTDPNHLWLDIENCDVPKDLQPELRYHRIKLEDRNYTGPLTITAIFAKTTEHISLDMLAKLPADIRTMDMGLYDADRAIEKEIEAFSNNPVNDPARNVMVMSGDKIFVKTLRDLRGKGYRTLAAFRVSSDEEELNAQVWDSWVFRQLLNLPWTVGEKPREEQDRKKKRSSSSAVLQHYCRVSNEKKLPALVSFLKKSPDQKVVIFFSSCSSVEYHFEMMRALDNDLRCLRIHGNLELENNLQAFSEFKINGGGLFLLCSDAVALGPHIQGVVSLCSIK